ncbi:MAG: YebC/PmpR family DNA-binding transcriptional regulator [Dehalococcoidales bacterium]|nr:MAG: YebC/PmpR family DNA-binding transcriptional regulator [Dehalococcoidales bacterium]
MSGHSKWASIKHQKGVADARRGQLFTKLTREIIVAVRQGGADTDMNFRLRLAVQKARDANMPMDNIERAIKRGSGETEGATLIEMVLEGYGPSGAAILVQALTDNKNRTVQEVRNLFSRNGGNLGESGCVAWLFSSKGMIIVDTNGNDPEELALQAIDAGAEDVKVETDYIEIYTTPEDFMTVRQTLEGAGITIGSSEVSMIPQNTLDLEEKPALQNLRLLHKLEELDEVQTVSSNVNFTDDVLEKFEA